MVRDREPGTALDVGMGEGRNALYLAKLGWNVTGFDPADKAVALAQQRADAMQLKVRTHVALDKDFEFGRERWDLIVYSWVPPTEPLTKVFDALRPGGIVVVEVGRDWYSRNELLQKFDPLRIIHYEVKRAPSDFFMNGDLQVVRLAAEKPVQK